MVGMRAVSRTALRTMAGRELSKSSRSYMAMAETAVRSADIGDPLLGRDPSMSRISAGSSASALITSASCSSCSFVGSSPCQRR